MSDTPTFTVILPFLPDGRIVLQRRTKDAPYGPGQLGTFGGWIEQGETPDESMKREFEEETSLKADSIQFELITEYTIPQGQDFPKDRHYYLYTCRLEDMDFEVYEGDGAEAFAIDEVIKRSDVTGGLTYLVEHVL